MFYLNSHVFCHLSSYKITRNVQIKIPLLGLSGCFCGSEVSVMVSRIIFHNLKPEMETVDLKFLPLPLWGTAGVGSGVGWLGCRG